jgi:hypothetical protein
MSEESPPLSHHGAARGKERAGLDRRALERTAGKALSHGLRPRDTTGSLRRYLDRLSIAHPGKHPRVHASHVFVFGSNDVLVTVMELPHNYRRSAASALKKRAAK